MQMDHVDQMGRVVPLSTSPPLRIVSLVPSQTELLFDLGLEAEVVGITKFCIHPKSWQKTKVRVGGTKDFKIEKVLELKPDLVIANKEENEKGSLELLEQFVPVWISNVRSITSATDMIESIGQITHRMDAANRLAEKITADFAIMPKLLLGKRVAYGIWYDPWMFASNDTFIGHLLSHLGATNVITDAEGRYPRLSLAQLAAQQPDLILLSSEPFPFKGKHAKQILGGIPNAKAVFVDGSFFSWYGSRLVHTTSYLSYIFSTGL